VRQRLRRCAEAEQRYIIGDDLDWNDIGSGRRLRVDLVG